MTFGESITTVFRKYAEFTGRASRPEFWWFTLFTTLVSMALGGLNVLTPDGTILIGSSLASVWGILVLLPSLAVAVRRLRDAGHAWTELLWLLLPVAGLIVLIVRLCDPTLPQAEDGSAAR
jgi:uncharacterized membrane protein YhaH (DUF805 family)